MTISYDTQQVTFSYFSAPQQLTIFNNCFHLISIKHIVLYKLIYNNKHTFHSFQHFTNIFVFISAYFTSAMTTPTTSYSTKATTTAPQLGIT